MATADSARAKAPARQIPAASPSTAAWTPWPSGSGRAARQPISSSAQQVESTWPRRWLRWSQRRKASGEERSGLPGSGSGRGLSGMTLRCGGAGTGRVADDPDHGTRPGCRGCREYSDTAARGQGGTGRRRRASRWGGRYQGKEVRSGGSVRASVVGRRGRGGAVRGTPAGRHVRAGAGGVTAGWVHDVMGIEPARSGVTYATGFPAVRGPPTFPAGPGTSTAPAWLGRSGTIGRPGGHPFP